MTGFLPDLYAILLIIQRIAVQIGFALLKILVFFDQLTLRYIVFCASSHRVNNFVSLLLLIFVMILFMSSLNFSTNKNKCFLKSIKPI